MTEPKPRLAFAIGTVVATPGAMEIVTHRQLAELLRRHCSGDWGDLSAEDKKANDEAVMLGGRIFSSYKNADGEKLWIVTESSRESTCVMSPDEY